MQPAAGTPAGVIPFATYNTGYSSGMNSGTTYASALSSGAGSGAAIQAGTVGGNANVYVGTLAAGALGLIVLFHLLGFRFAFDVEVGRRG
jgi:hypothetical protein